MERVTTEQALTAMAIWEFIWDEANWSYEERNKDDMNVKDRYWELCRGCDGWGAVRETTLAYVAPAVDRVYEIALEDAARMSDNGFHSFDWDFVPDFIRAMLALSIPPKRLEFYESEILAAMGMIDPPKVIRIELDRVNDPEGDFSHYGIYKRLDNGMAEYIGSQLNLKTARARGQVEAAIHRVEFLDTTATDRVRVAEKRS